MPITFLKFELRVCNVGVSFLKLLKLPRSLDSVVCHSSDKKECRELYLAYSWPLLEFCAQFGDSNFPKGTEKLERVQDKALKNE